METIKFGDTEFFYVQKDFRRVLEAIPKGMRLAGDTETCVQEEWKYKGGSALDPHTGQISLAILYADRSKMPPLIFDMITCSAEDKLALSEWLMTAEYLIAHNAKFDIQMFMSSLELYLRKIHCTMLMSQILANATGSKYGMLRGHSYADVCRDFLNVHLTGKKELRQSTWGISPEARTAENSWWAEKLAYGARDVMYLPTIHDLLERVIRLPGPYSTLNRNGAPAGREYGLDMGAALELEWKVTPVAALAEYTGLPVSKPMLNGIMAGIKDQLQEAALKLCGHFNLETTVADPWTGVLAPTEKSMKVLRSPAKLKDLIASAISIGQIDTTESQFLERMMDIIDQLGKGFSSAEDDTDSPTTSTVTPDFISEEEEDMFAELLQLEESTLHHSSEIIKDLLLFKRMVKQEGMDLRKFINPKTGRIHYSLDQGRAATGRFASRRPNVQQIPARLYLNVEVMYSDLFRCTSAGSQHLEFLLKSTS